MKIATLASFVLFCLGSLAMAQATQPADQLEAALDDWGTLKYPADIKVGQLGEAVVTLKDTHDGQKVVFSLNWLKTDKSFGGFNTIGLPQNQDATAGEHRFTFRPKEKPDLGAFVITVYLSPSGEWKDRTKHVNVQPPTK